MLYPIQFSSQFSKEMADTNERGPEYYKRGKQDAWDFIREQGLNFHLGNAIKYIVRAGYKDSKISDLTKAIHYLQNELEHTINNTPTAGQRIQDFVWDHELEVEETKKLTEESNH